MCTKQQGQSLYNICTLLGCYLPIYAYKFGILFLLWHHCIRYIMFIKGSNEEVEKKLKSEPLTELEKKLTDARVETLEDLALVEESHFGDLL